MLAVCCDVFHFDNAAFWFKTLSLYLEHGRKQLGATNTCSDTVGENVDGEIDKKCPNEELFD